MTHSNLDLKVARESVLPCPFCDGKAETFMDVWYNSNPGYSGGQGKRVRCTVCGSLGKWVNVDYFNMFSKFTVEDFRHNNSLRASEEDRYEAYINSKELEAIEHWNNRPALSRTRQETREELAVNLDSLAEELFNACVDNPDMQMTWNSALRQSAYKVQALARNIRELSKESGK